MTLIAPFDISMPIELDRCRALSELVERSPVGDFVGANARQNLPLGFRDNLAEVRRRGV